MRRQGFTEWEKPKDKAREAGVCFVYAYAAVCGLQALSGRFVALGKMKGDTPSEVQAEPEPETGEATAPDTAAASARHTPQPIVKRATATKRQQDWLPKKRRSSWL